MRNIISTILCVFALLLSGSAGAQTNKKYWIYGLVKFDYRLVERNGVSGYNLGIRFYNYDKAYYKDETPYTVRLKLWNDPEMAYPFPGQGRPQRTFELKYDGLHPLDKERTLFVPYDDFSAAMTATRGGNYYTSDRAFYSIDIYKSGTNSPLVSITPYFSSETMDYKGWFEYTIFHTPTSADGVLNWNDKETKESQALIARHPEEDPEAQDFNGQYLKVSYQPFDGKRLKPLDDFEVRMKFYHGNGRSKPCMFYEMLDEFDAKGNNRVFYSKDQWSKQAYEDEMIEERSQPTNELRRRRHDWNPFCVFVPDNIIWFADEDEEKTARKENDTITAYVDLYTPGGTPIYESKYYHYQWIRYPYTEPEIEAKDNTTWESIVCEDDTDVPQDNPPHPGNRTQVGTVEAPEEEPEPSCPPHDFMLVKKEPIMITGISTRYDHEELMRLVYKCKKCGIMKYDKAVENHQHQFEREYTLCQKIRPWTVRFKGVPFSFRLVTGKSDSTALYVATTEMTRGQWAVLFPENHQHWKIGDNAPVAGVTPEDADIIISGLNNYASQKDLPLRFRMPTAKEWAMAYACADKAGLQNMKGGVAEMCSDTIVSTAADGQTVVLTAVAGNSSNDDIATVAPDALRYLDLGRGNDSVGVRIVAEPVLGDDGELEADTALEESKNMNVGEKNLWGGYEWVVRHVYQCKICHRPYYSPLSFTARGNGNERPFVCDMDNNKKK